MTKSKRLRRKAIAAGAAIAVLAIGCLFIIEPRPRIFYSPWNSGAQGSVTTRAIREEYAEKRRAGVEWTKNPVQVAEWLALGSNNYGTAGNLDWSEPTKVTLYPDGEDRLTVIVLEDPVKGDDSVAAEEHRLDLKRAADGAWDVEWGGSRWRCDPERSGGFGWWRRFSLCS